MSNFDELVAIIGNDMSMKVIEKLGGRVVRVRKSIESYREKAGALGLDLAALTAAAIARRLGCSPACARKLKTRSVQR